MLEWLWNYGNEHKVTRTNRKIRPVTQSSFNVDASSRASPKLRTKHQDESPCKKPLLNHLLRSTYQRAQHQRISRQEYIKVNQQSLSVGVAIHDAEAESPRREPLQVMTLNRQAVSTDHVKLHPID